MNEDQIEIIQGEKRFSNPRPTSDQPPVFIGYDYEMYDSRFITNTIYLVSLNVMKQYAMQCGVPFPTTISKTLIPFYSDLRFYELPSDKPFLQRYNDLVQKMVKDPARNALSLSSEDYCNLYHHCVHISGNYNRSILGRETAKNLPVLFINRPTENKKRKFLKPK